ncbi:MAG: hypothetical protein GX799_05580 [Crenarchaeota archaeon]|nr:hypothetical protein [Thermoproteota archaeon]
MTDKQNPSQISNINTKISKFKEQIVENNAQIKKFLEKRDLLNEKVRIAREEVTKLKVERDALNEKVKELKKQRDAVRVSVGPLLAEINLIDEKVAALKKNLPRINYRETKKELEDLEFKIATTTVDLQEEKRLVEQVKQLEIQLVGFKKIDSNRKKIKDIIEHRKTFDEQAEVYHNELTEVAKKSQDLHAVMMEKINVIKKDREQADSLHQSFIKAKEQNNQLYEQIRQLIAQSTGIKTTLRDQYIARRKEEETKRQLEHAEQVVKEQAMKEKIGTQAREKLNRGEKVSWDEFALMLGDVKDDEAETQT